MTPISAVTLGPIVLRVRSRTVVVTVVLLLVLLLGMVAALCVGEYAVTPARAVAAVFGGGDPIDRLLIVRLRLPRVLAGALVGIALGTAGALFQSVSRNPLGSPDVIGFTSGASTGALVAILVLHAGAVPTAFGALLGGALTAAVVYGLSAHDGVSPLRLVLVGLGAGAMLSALNSLFVVQAQIYDAQSASAWLIGNLAGSGWGSVLLLLPVVGVGLLLAGLLGRPLALAEFSDERTRSLGAHPQVVRLGAIAVGVLLACGAVAVGGPIQFIALAAPQIARRLTRGSGPHVLSAGIAGGVLLVLSDLVAREAFQPREYAVGVVTGIVGGGYLAWLLGREWKAGRT